MANKDLELVQKTGTATAVMRDTKHHKVHPVESESDRGRLIRERNEHRMKTAKEQLKHDKSNEKFTAEKTLPPSTVRVDAIILIVLLAEVNIFNGDLKVDSPDDKWYLFQIKPFDSNADHWSCWSSPGNLCVCNGCRLEQRDSR